MVRVYADVKQLDNCCGVLEIGDIGEGNRIYVGVCATGDTLSNAFKALLDAIISSDDSEDADESTADDFGTQGKVLQVWFHKLRKHNDTFESEYVSHELRELVRAIPNVVRLGTIVNSNSGNIIDGYCWANNAKVIDES